MDNDLKYVSDFLETKNVKIDFIKRLAGGVISSVWSGILHTEDRQAPCVIKYTKDRPSEMPIPFNSRVDHFVSAEGHNLDTDILVYLGNQIQDTNIIVPKIFSHFPDEKITVMEDLTSAPYDMELFAHNLPDGVSNEAYAANLGRAVALISDLIAKNDLKFKSTEGTFEQFEERGRGALFTFHNNQVDYKKFLNFNLEENNPLVLTDVHPKNLFFSKDGSVSVIDFGRTVHGDPQFTVPNFLSHIFLVAAIGLVDIDSAFKFIDSFIKAYTDTSSLKIDEERFCFYVGVEILGRACGRWVNYVDEDKDIDKKTALTYMGQVILNKNFNKIQDLKDLARNVYKGLNEGKFSL